VTSCFFFFFLGICNCGVCLAKLAIIHRKDV
jgi:hypothetical protein